MRKGIIIVGMHRSGTSALAGLMNILGFNIGYNLLVGKKYFNQKQIYKIKINNFYTSVNNYFSNKIKKSIEKEIKSKKKFHKLFYSKFSNFMITFRFYLN